MLKPFLFSLLFGVICSEPGYDYGLGPVAVVSPLLSSPILAPAPILTQTPIIKTIAPVTPIIKTIAPATSYATITKVYIAHPAPIIKAILTPQPLLKNYYHPPLTYGHGFH